MLLAEHLEANGLPPAEADDHSIQLERTRRLHHELLVGGLIDIDELLPTQHQNKVAYLVGEVNPL